MKIRNFTSVLRCKKLRKQKISKRLDVFKFVKDEILDAISPACMCFNFGHQFSKKILKNHLNYNLSKKKKNNLNYKNYVLLIINKNFLDTWNFHSGDLVARIIRWMLRIQTTKDWAKCNLVEKKYEFIFLFQFSFRFFCGFQLFIDLI